MPRDVRRKRREARIHVIPPDLFDNTLGDPVTPFRGTPHRRKPSPRRRARQYAMTPKKTPKKSPKKSLSKRRRQAAILQKPDLSDLGINDDDYSDPGGASGNTPRRGKHKARREVTFLDVSDLDELGISGNDDSPPPPRVTKRRRQAGVLRIPDLSELGLGIGDPVIRDSLSSSIRAAPLLTIPEEVDSVAPALIIPSPRKTDPAKDYDLQGKIGSGSYGVVTLLKHKQSGRQLACKKIANVKDAKERGLVEREVTILQNINHPNIIMLVDSYSYNNNDAYLLFEYCSKCDLTTINNNSRNVLTPARIKFILNEILKGLQHIHGKGVVHRDIKPENILVDSEGNVKIADFGSARQIDKAKGRNRKYSIDVGTAWYRAPEMILGKTDYGSEVDMWSLGCLAGGLYQGEAIMTGWSPGASQMRQIAELCGEMPDLPGIKPPFPMPEDTFRVVKEHFEAITDDVNAADFVDKLLSLDPSQRPTADECVEFPLFISLPLAQGFPMTLAQNKLQIGHKET